MSERARVGPLIPSSPTGWSSASFPEDATPHVARLRMTGPHHVAVEELLTRIEEATRTLVDARCDIVAFHCTATSMEDGMAGEKRVVEALMRAGAAHATTTATAIPRAFAALGARRIVLVTPYDAATTAAEALIPAGGWLRDAARGRLRARRQRCLLRGAPPCSGATR